MLIYCEVCEARPLVVGLALHSGIPNLPNIVYCMKDQSAYDGLTGRRLTIDDIPAFYDRHYVAPTGRFGRLVESREELSPPIP